MVPPLPTCSIANVLSSFSPGSLVNVFGCRPTPNLSACTTGRCSKTSGEGTRGVQGTGTLSAYGDFSSSGAKRAAALRWQEPRVTARQSALAALAASDRRRSDGDEPPKQARFCSFRQAAPSPAFERRLEPAIDAMETVLDRIMTYRTPLAGMACCADGRPLRNAR